MSFRTAIPALDAIDQVLGTKGLDLRPTVFTITTRTFVDGCRSTDPAAYSDSVLVMPTWIRIRHVSTREILASGGLYETGDVRIGPIRPPFTRPDGTAGGFTEAQIAPIQAPLAQNPITAQGVEVFYTLAAAPGHQMGISGVYGFREYKRDRAMHHTLVVHRLYDTP